MLLLSMIQITIPNSPIIGYASASTTWTQTTDEDFDEGYHLNTTIIGVGENAEVRLDNTKVPHWTQKTPSSKPSGRSSHGMATIFGTDKVLLFGGSVSNKAVNDTWVYDLSANTWTEKNPINSPYPRGGVVITPIYNTDKVLLFGGYNQTALNETWIYDLSDNTWVNKMPVISPSPRYSHAMSPIPGTDKVLLFGGYPGGLYTYPHNDTWIYDLSENNWTNKTSTVKPHARYSHTIAYIDGTDKILLFGGRFRNWSYDVHFDDTWIYDYSENNWTQKYPVKSPIGNNNHLMVTIYGTDNVVVYAGLNGVYLVDVCIYDYSDNNWSIHSPMVFPRTGSTLGMASVHGTDKAIFFGAWSGSSRDETWLYDNSIQAMKGFYLSPEFYTFTNPNYKTIMWNDFTPIGTTVSLQFRTAPYRNWLHNRNFVGPDGTRTSSYTTSPAALWSGHNGDEWMQFRIYFATNNLPNVPTVYNISLVYNWLPEKPILGLPLNDTWVNTSNPEFNWTFIDPDSSSQESFQWIADDNITFSSIDYNSSIVNSNSTRYTPFHPMEDGVWYWKVRTRDADGDWGEYSEPLVVKIDTTIEKPKNLIVEPDGWSAVNSYFINWENPEDATGIAGAYYKLDEQPVSNNDGTFISIDDITSINKITVNNEGEHTIYIWLQDELGNVNFRKNESAKLYLDTTAPDAPINLDLTPSGWTDRNEFSVKWENPMDISGIGGCYYKLDSEPTSHYDGYIVIKNDISQLTNVTVSENGVHSIFIWLQDRVGNVNFDNYNSIKFYYDDTPPTKPMNIEVTPSYWSSVNSFSINWTDPDDIAGIRNGSYYCMKDEPPSEQNDGVWVTDKPLRITDAREGKNQVYIWLEDIVGNKDFLNYNSVELKLDTKPPKITHSPITDLMENEELIIQAEISDELSGTDDVLLKFKKPSEQEYSILQMEEVNNIYSIKVPSDMISIEGIEYYIEVSDNSVPKNKNYFGVDGETEIKPTGANDIDIKISALPKIIDNSPLGVDIPVNSIMNITFNKIMNGKSTMDAFSISPHVEGELVFSGNKLEFKPGQPLFYNMTYTIIISRSAKDQDGNNLEKDFKWTFTTESQELTPEPPKKDRPKDNSWQLGLSLFIILIIILLIIIFYMFVVRKKQLKQKTQEGEIKPAGETPTTRQPQVDIPTSAPNLYPTPGPTSSTNYPTTQQQPADYTYQKQYMQQNQSSFPAYQPQQNYYTSQQQVQPYNCENCGTVITTHYPCPYCGYTPQIF